MPEIAIPGNSIITGTRKTGNFNSDFIIRDVEKDIYLMEPYNYPLFQYLFLQKNKSIQTNHVHTKHEWGEDELLPNLDTHAANGSGGSTTMTIVPTTTALYRIGIKVRFEETDEVGVVTAISPNIVVTKSTSGNWTSVTSGTNIHLLGSKHGENDSVPTARSMNKVMFHTYCGIFQETISMTERMIASTMNGGTYGGNDWSHQQKARALEVKRDIEQRFWWNLDPEYAVNGSSEVSTDTAGVFWQVENRGGQALTYAGAMDETEFDDILKQKKRGSNQCTLFAGVDLAADIEKIVKARYSNIGPVKKYGAIDGSNNVDVITYSAVGKTVDIVRCPLWEGKYSRYGALLDDGYVKLLHASPDHKGSRRMRIEMGIEDNGAPRKEAQIKADVGVAVTGAAACITIKPQ